MPTDLPTPPTFTVRAALRDGWTAYRLRPGLFAAAGTACVLVHAALSFGLRFAPQIPALSAGASVLELLGFVLLATALFSVVDAGTRLDGPSGVLGMLPPPRRLLRSAACFYVATAFSVVCSLPALACGASLLSAARMEDYVSAVAAGAAFTLATAFAIRQTTLVALWLPIVATRDAGIIESLKQSARIAKGRVAPLATLLLLIALINILAALPFGLGLPFAAPFGALALLSAARMLARDRVESKRASIRAAEATKKARLTATALVATAILGASLGYGLAVSASNYYKATGKKPPRVTDAATPPPARDPAPPAPSSSPTP